MPPTARQLLTLAFSGVVAFGCGLPPCPYSPDLGEGITCYDSGQGQRLYQGLSLTVDQISDHGRAGITVSGFVTDTTGGYSVPMQYAAVLVGRVWPGYPSLQRPNRRTYADDSGHFVLDSLAADDTLTVVSLAYAPVSTVVSDLRASGDGR